ELLIDVRDDLRRVGAAGDRRSSVAEQADAQSLEVAEVEIVAVGLRNRQTEAAVCAAARAAGAARATGATRATALIAPARKQHQHDQNEPHISVSLIDLRGNLPLHSECNNLTILSCAWSEQAIRKRKTRRKRTDAPPAVNAPAP